MQRRTRTRLFYSLCGLFLLIGSLTVFYAEGWRVSFSPFAIKKVGGIYVRTYPKDTLLSVNETFIDDSVGLFESGRLIGNLFPRQYTIKAEAAGYLPWERNITVQPALVKRFESVVLVPQIAHIVSSSSIAHVKTTDGGPLVETTQHAIVAQYRILRGTRLIATNESGNVILTQDTNGTLWIHILDTHTSTSFPALLASWGFSKNNTNLILDPSNDEGLIITSHGLFLTDFSSSPPIILQNPLFLKTPRSIHTSPKFVSWTTFNSNTNISSLVIYDKETGTFQSSTSEIPGRVSQTLPGNGIVGILTTSRELFSYEIKTDTLKKISSEVTNVTFSGDGSKLATLHEGSLEIFSFDIQEPGYVRFSIEKSKNINDLLWYKDNMHFFLINPTELMFADLADESLVLDETIPRGEEYAYGPKENNVYILKNHTLLSYQFPE